MGEILADYPRHTLVLSTKVYWPMSKDVNDHGLSRKHVRESITKSLRRLNTDYVDLYFAHRYDANRADGRDRHAFSDLVDEGKILYWGTSEWPAARIAEANTFAVSQRPAPAGRRAAAVHPARPRARRGRILLAERFGMGLVVWSPLAMGMLTGKYDDGVPEGSRLAADEGFRGTSSTTTIRPGSGPQGGRRRRWPDAHTAGTRVGAASHRVECRSPARPKSRRSRRASGPPRSTSPKTCSPVSTRSWRRSFFPLPLAGEG